MARYVRQGSKLVRVTSPAVAPRQAATPRSGKKSSIAARLVARAVIGKRSAAPAARTQLVRSSASSRKTLYCPTYCRCDHMVWLHPIMFVLLNFDDLHYFERSTLTLDVLCVYRTGTCAEQAYRQCSLLHDKSKVAVCPAWLNGSCPNSAECNLQHKACLDLMPLCTFFLKVVSVFIAKLLGKASVSVNYKQR